MEDQIRADWLESPVSSEAALYKAITEGQVETALKKALSWHFDEPWAARPMIAASYLAVIKGDFGDSSAFAQSGLVLEPENIALLNNHAFSLLCQRKVEPAIAAIAKASRSQEAAGDPHTLANFGFLAYLCGEYDTGFRAYTEAVRRYEKAGRPDAAAMARICHALAAQGSQSDSSEQLREAARKAAADSKDLMVKQAAVRLIGLDAPSVALPPPDQQRVRRWVYDHKHHVLRIQS